MRPNDREPSELRPVRITPNFTEMAAGSVLMECGRTRLICTASVDESVPPFLRGKGQGWVTAEYAMLPGATPQRKARDGVKKDGRSVEIQRLIGRSVRACMDLSKLGERTITLDCDVIQADGGTRTAAITGAFCALCLAVSKLLSDGRLIDSPVAGQLAAVSVGIVDKVPMLDLEYVEDSIADVDMNLVMVRGRSGEMKLVEVQGTGEGAAFSRAELNRLVDLGEAGVTDLMEAQRTALGEAAHVICQKPKLIIATGNFGKLKEMKQLLGELYDVVTMRELGLDVDVEETGETFEQNALIKAEALMNLTKTATIADDSGLEVDALGGRPGVYSARYCGVHGDDHANNELLLKELHDIPDPRTARFVSAVALMRPGKRPLVTRGECCGRIIHEYRGEGGFGYDPLFLSDDLDQTFGEASMEAKSHISHRARAIAKLKSLLEAEAE